MPSAHITSPLNSHFPHLCRGTQQSQNYVLMSFFIDYRPHTLIRSMAFLECPILGLILIAFPFIFQISFIRRRDFHILTNGHSVYTNDPRIEIFHAAKSHDWYLVIKKASHNDSGVYECQVRHLLKTDYIKGQ